MSDNDTPKVIDFTEMKAKRDAAKADAKTAKFTGSANADLMDRLCEVIDNQDAFVGMIIQDFQLLVGRIGQLEAAQFNASLYIENIQTIVQEHFVETEGLTKEQAEDRFRETWNRDIVPRLKILKDEQEKVSKELARKKAKSDSKIILPEKGFIIPK